MVINSQTGPRVASALIDDAHIFDVTDGAKGANGEESDSGPLDGERRVEGLEQYFNPGYWALNVHVTYVEILSGSVAGFFLQHGITNVLDRVG